MCEIIYKPAGVPASNLTAEQLSNAITNNPDGAGIATREKDGTLSYIKGLFLAEDITREWNRARTHADTILHVRITTHGKTNTANTHPFLIGRKDNPTHYTILPHDDDALLFHNGILDIETGKKSALSDTATACRYRPETLRRMLSNPHNETPAERKLRNSSRLLIISPCSLSMRGRWYYENGLYFSNQSHNTKPYSKTDYPSKYSLTNYNQPLTKYDGEIWNTTTCDSCGHRIGYNTKTTTTLYIDDIPEYYCAQCWEYFGEEIIQEALDNGRTVEM